jgi:hypothetical protein
MTISSHVQKLVLADRRDTEPSSLSPQLCQHIAVPPASIARRRSQDFKPRDKLDYKINPDFINYVKIVFDT